MIVIYNFMQPTKNQSSNVLMPAQVICLNVAKRGFDRNTTFDGNLSLFWLAIALTWAGIIK